MRLYKYSIELAFKKNCDIELAANQFTMALEIPKRFQENLKFLTLRYNESEKDLAIDHCLALNKELSENGFNQVEFRIKEIVT